MRILLINKYHFLKGGAERAYFELAELLEKHGHQVAFFSMHHQRNEKSPWHKYFVPEVDYQKEKQSLLSKIKLAVKLVYNRDAKKNLAALIDEFRPEVAHLHNIYHQLSPSVIDVLREKNIPIVMTLHDFKLINPNYSLYVRGKIWEKDSLWACIKDRCVKDSYLKSFVGVAEKLFHHWRKTYDKVDVFISPSRFLIRKFRQHGFKKKIVYLPNPLVFDDQSKNSSVVNFSQAGSDAPLLCFGRLSREKGFEVAIRAMKKVRSRQVLWIAGEGPEQENLKKLVRKLKLQSQVKFLGYKKGGELEELIRKAKAVILPSVWYENMPYVMVESLARNKVLIASRLGGMPEWIKDGENGFLFPAGNAAYLARIIDKLDRIDLQKLADNAGKVREQLQPDEIVSRIENIYQKLVARKLLEKLDKKA
jgi:glycosyltransferase involved in cell wall biosynthesis